MESILIGDLNWCNKDFKTLKFRNGDNIPQAKTTDDWIEASKKHSPCLFIIDDTYYYNHFVLNDRRGIAPEGYSIPNKTQWIDLINFLDSQFGPGNNIPGRYLSSKKGDTNIGFNIKWDGRIGDHNNLTYKYKKDHNEIVLFKDKQAFFWAQNKNLSKDFACVFWIDKKSKITDIDNSYPLGCGNLIRLIKN